MYHVTLHGLEIRCDDPSEVVRLAKEAGLFAVTKRGPGRPPKENGRPQREAKEERAADTTLAFLTAIASSTGGINGDVIVSTMGLKDKRGIGGALSSVRRVLSESGFAASEVFSMRGQRLKRRWKSGPRLQEAIAKLGANGVHAE